MKWIDYRDALGLGFSEEDKKSLLANKLSVLFKSFGSKWDYCQQDICAKYFLTVSEAPSSGFYWFEVEYSITRDNTTMGIVSKAVALINSCWSLNRKQEYNYFKKFLTLSLDELNIQYDIYEDQDGAFVFPKGAKELDQANVNVPFEWLKKYPVARQAMTLALESYSNKNDPSNTADLFRKALESFIQEFFKKQCTLENAKSLVGAFLNERGVPKELTGNFETTLQMYSNYINSYAKHHSKTSEQYLEFIMYQTGNIIRFIMSLDD